MEPAITGKRLNHISHSQIRSAQCLLRYFHINVEKDFQYDYEPFIVGKAIHEVVHDYSVYCRENKINAGDPEILEEIIQQISKKHNLTNEQQVEVRRMCFTFAETEINFDDMLGAEHEFIVEIGKDENNRPIRFAGIIDRVDAKVYGQKAILQILDYKSQKNVMTRQEVNDDLQLRLYRYASVYHEWKHFNYVQFGLYHLHYGFIRWGDEVYKGDLWNEFQSMEDYIGLYWEKISHALTNQKWEPERGPWCWAYTGCPLLQEKKCPLWTTEEINAQGPKIHKNIRTLRLWAFDTKQMRDELALYFKDREPQIVDNEAVGYENKITVKYPALAVLKWAEDMGLTKYLDMTFSEASVNKFLKLAQKDIRIDEQSIEVLRECQIEDMSRRFHV